ncbi:MAG: ComEC/Rec2 family competence protein [Treponema sp.]|nr:ComEC/Rec2 family competence protein [Treponema sp.]
MVIHIINRLVLPPIQYAAAGAAIGFYFLFHAHIAFIIVCFLLLLAAFNFFKVLSSFNKESRMFHIAAVCSAAFTIGLSVGLCAAAEGYNNVNFGIPQENVIAIEGVLLEDPRIISSGSIMAGVSLRRCAGENGLRVSSRGDVMVFFPPESADRLKQFGRGAVIFAEGSLRSSDTPGNWTVSAKSLHVVKKAPAIEQMRTGIRLNLISRFDKLQNSGGLALALLLGIRDNLDTALVSVYRNAGLSYILALSGMHLAILTAIISFLLKRPLGLKGCAIAGAIFILLYCLFVGPMPSLYRAALMYILGVLAILGALPKKAMSILSLSFIIQIILTPAAGNSLSFILSYLALLGILITGKALIFIFEGKIPSFLLQPLSISCGAFISTAGVCILVFGYIKPAGIIAGLFIVPLTTLFMTGSIIWLVLDFISLSFLLNFPLSVLYRFMELIASLSSYIPGISSAHYVVLVLSIILMLLITVLEQRRRAAMLKLESFP